MRPTDLRGILRYVPQFRERTFVIAADGAIVADDNFGNILMDVAVLRSLNIRTVLVHGASAQIQALADEKVAAPSDLEGSGVTDAATLQLALAAATRLTHEVLEGLSAADLRGASTNAVTAHPLGILRGVDHLFTGRVERVDAELKFRQAWAAEAKAERELREKILKGFYAVMAVVTLFIVALFFF